VVIRRFVKLLLAGVFAASAVSFALLYWAAIRPLARTSDTVTGPGVPPASAGRDRLGIPHIEAGSVEDALWVQGYVTAQDRLWQMDLLRRISAGELAEGVGAGMIAVERGSRTVGIPPAGVAGAGRPPAPRRARSEGC